MKRRRSPVRPLTARSPLLQEPARRLSLILLGVAVAAAVLNWALQRNESAPVGATLLAMGGAVSVQHADAGQGPALAVGQSVAVQRGDTVTTGAEGRARLTLEGDHTIELDPHTTLALAELTQNRVTGAQTAVVELHRGQARAQARAGAWRGLRLHVETRAASVELRQGLVECALVGEERLRVRVLEGTARVASGPEAVELGGGQTVEAIVGQPLAGQGGTPIAPPTARPAGTAPAPAHSPAPTAGASGRPTLTDRQKTLFPPAITPTRPGDDQVRYTVQPGDTLSSIANKFGLPWESIYAANRDVLQTPEMLRAGQQLRIPAR
ncbi:MAG: LysM domain-containing protein [Chloroflexota bacterium]